ncbi:Uncharacterised protein [Vibrio cholerae]|nr:Uncharacterised protein [Vibrio cholerae]
MYAFCSIVWLRLFSTQRICRAYCLTIFMTASALISSYGKITNC